MPVLGPLPMVGVALEAPRGGVGERLILAAQPLARWGTSDRSVDWRLKQAAVNARLT